MSLNTTVIVHTPRDGHDGKFGPGDPLPEWAAVQIGAHCFEGGIHPYPELPYPGNTAVASAEPEVQRVPGAEPPRAGRGASRDAWAAFAAEHAQPVVTDDTRDSIIAKLIAAGVIAAPEAPSAVAVDASPASDAVTAPDGQDATQQ